jgi:hypothetical protein
MAQDKQPTPTDAFTDMVTQWERNFDAFANQLMGTEGFSQAMNGVQNAQLGQQQKFSQSMAQYFSSMNLPTRDDILGLADAIHQVNQRLDRIEEKLGAGAVTKTKTKKKKRPARTKKPPKESTDA